LIASIKNSKVNGIKPLPKRTPKSKSGRLLCSITQRLILIAASEYIATGSAKNIKVINHNIDRIQKRLNKETKNKYPQAELFMNFSVTFIPANRKRKKTTVVTASTKRRAHKFIRMVWGKETKILKN
jgi:hypothetical protein